MKIKFVKQDFWIGLFWKNDFYETVEKEDNEEFFVRHYYTRWYLCLIPCFPIIWDTETDVSK